MMRGQARSKLKKGTALRWLSVIFHSEGKHFLRTENFISVLSKNKLRYIKCFKSLSEN